MILRPAVSRHHGFSCSRLFWLFAELLTRAWEAGWLLLSLSITSSTQFVRRAIGGRISCRERVPVRWLDSLYSLLSSFILAWECARLFQANLLRRRARFHSGVLVLPFALFHCSRGYQGVGPTKNERYEKKAKVLPDPVPRAEMEH